MNKARDHLSQLTKKEDKPNKWVWYINVGGEETLSIAIPHNNNAERGQVQSFADFAAKHIGQKDAEAWHSSLTRASGRRTSQCSSTALTFLLRRRSSHALRSGAGTVGKPQSRLLTRDEVAP